MNITAAKVTIYMSIIGGLFAAATWLSSVVVTKNDLLLATNEIRLAQIQESLITYQRMGIATLDDTDKHRYNNLLESEKVNVKQRRKLLGMD